MNSSQTYGEVNYYEPQDILDSWNFFTSPDPSGGSVNYLGRSQATSAGLAYVDQQGSLVLAVDSTTVLPLGANRNSVRISSPGTYTTGLFIADFSAMPWGCSVWPAWWSCTADSWPAGGEIDVVEGVNDQTVNQYTLHSGPGASCTLDSAPPPLSNAAASTEYTGTVVGTQCLSSASNDDGCGFVDTSTTSYGQGFNAVGGGVFAHLWDSNGIWIWHWTRSNIPADITARNPNPATWGAAVAFWSAATCNIQELFYNHVLTVDTTVCGGWAGAVYSSSGCAGTCEEAVTNPSNFVNAQWKVNYVSVYNAN